MKVLIIRFSSFGDVLQTLSVAGRIKASWPQAEVHWVTREEFSPLIDKHPAVHRVWTLPRGAGFQAVWQLGGDLAAQDFTHVYDAHNNLRSHVIGLRVGGFMGWRRWTGRQKFLRRSIFRVRRFLLFQFRWNLFPKPFSGQRALLEPLKKWDLSVEAPNVPQLFLPEEKFSDVKRRLPVGWNRYVALAPSAAFELKRWPLEYWADLVRQEKDLHFVVLGGPEDTFLRQLVAVAPDRVCNLAGSLSLSDSALIVEHAAALISNDTGLMHVAEQCGVPCLALMGPAPFGFPSRPLTQIFELDLACRPCSKHGQGPCVNVEYQKCLRGIPPARIGAALRKILHA